MFKKWPKKKIEMKRCPSCAIEYEASKRHYCLGAVKKAFEIAAVYNDPMYTFMVNIKTSTKPWQGYKRKYFTKDYTELLNDYDDWNNAIGDILGKEISREIDKEILDMLLGQSKEENES